MIDKRKVDYFWKHRPVSRFWRKVGFTPDTNLFEPKSNPEFTLNLRNQVMQTTHMAHTPTSKPNAAPAAGALL
jgi:hypothetical protein